MVVRLCGGRGMFRMHCHSVRDFFLAILLLSSISMTILYELSLPWIRQTEKEFHQHMDRAQRSPENGLNCYSAKRKQNSGLIEELENNKTDILIKVQKIEERILGIKASRRAQKKYVMMQGSRELMEQELPVYEPALKKYGFVVQVPRWYRGQSPTTNGVMTGKPVHQAGESPPAMLILMEGASPSQGNLTATHLIYLKVNQIPQYLVHLTPVDQFCLSVRWAQDNMVIRPSVVSPACYLVPDHQEELLDVVQQEQQMWRVIPVGGSQSKISSSWKNSSEVLEMMKHNPGERCVVQQTIPNSLVISDSPFLLKVYVLVTSVLPLRAYRHTQATIQLLNYHGSKPPDRSWTMEQWTEYLYETYGQDAVSQVKHNLHSSITETLLVTNHKMADHVPESARCLGCFQLLEFDMAFNTTFHAFVLEVRGQPRVEHLSSWSAYASKQQVIQDMVTLVSGRSSMAAEVTNLVSGMKLDISVSGKGCVNDPEMCLGEADVVYLLESRQESLAAGGFLKLYPTREGDEYLPVVSRLSALSHLRRRATGHHGALQPHLTNLHQHSMLVNAERFYTSVAAEETDVAYDDVNIPVSQDEKSSQERKDANLRDQPIIPECSNDKSQLPYLTTIHFSPPLKLSPAFQPVTSEYMAVVDYKTYLLQVWAVAKSCYCEARLEEKYGLSRPANVTLGLGDNKITIFVVDLSHGDPWVINTYSVIVYRKGPAEGLTPFHLGLPHQVCSIKQDCSLLYSPREPCGLQLDRRFDDWSLFTQNVSALPVCQSGDVPGQWFVPCERCHEGAVCYWDEAKWQPQTCQHLALKRGTVQTCFTGKKVLFIGDSTSRGILHYLAEAVNGTLTEWDKTHNLKVYQNLNNGSTLLGFAYYPQFWLPAPRRPVFEDALHQLIKRTSPLSNSSDTVLVVGGVHWLSTHHINVIMSKLEREGLTGIKIIIKGLGSGFHQPVEGLHCLSKSEHQKLLHRNQLVTKYASDKGFHILETFNMTMSRYKDFLQGKCACHFHRVSPARQESKSHDKEVRRSQGHGSSSLSVPAQYHVEGGINAVYSEILINIICDSHLKDYSVHR